MSYMCQVQWSGPMLPRLAAIPPCAATVWLRVGKTLVTQAVFSPFSAAPMVARRPGAAGADDDDVIDMVDDLVGAQAAAPKAILASANRASAAPPTARNSSRVFSAKWLPASWT